MDLKKFGMEELLLAAMKAEIESRTLYITLASTVKNAFLKDRLKFLASEEDKHKKFIEDIFETSFPGKKPMLPKISPVPMASVVIVETNPHVSVVLAKAMVAEKVARAFYLGLAKRFKGDRTVKASIEYLAIMEQMHYDMLGLEVDRLKAEEDYIIEWPMMHAGP